MEFDFGCDLDTQVFEPNEPVTHNLLKYQIVEALKTFEKRIAVEREDIDIIAQGEKIFANIHFTVISYQSEHDVTVVLGGEQDGS